MTTEIVAIMGDTHINSTVGLCKPSVNLDDGGTYQASKGQRWLWHNFLDYVDAVNSYRVSTGGKVTLILNGDTLEADTKGRSRQVITRNKADILKIAYMTMEPMLKVADRVIVIRGTAAHVGKSAEYEEEFASDITNIIPNGEINSFWTRDIEIGGVLLNLAHHGKVGRMPHTKTNPMNTLATIIMFYYAGRRVPDIVIRSHNHVKGDTYDNYPCRVLALPAWQLSTEYSYRGTFGKADIGGYILLCEKGKAEVVKKLYKIPDEKPLVLR
jgi:hypothetical protein